MITWTMIPEELTLITIRVDDYRDTQSQTFLIGNIGSQI